MKTTLLGLTGYARAGRTVRWNDVGMLSAAGLAVAAGFAVVLAVFGLVILFFGRALGCW